MLDNFISNKEETEITIDRSCENENRNYKETFGYTMRCLREFNNHRTHRIQEKQSKAMSRLLDKSDLVDSIK